MTKSYEINVCAKNTLFHRSANFVLNGDNKFVEVSRSDGREYRDEAEAIVYFKDYCTQEQANKFAVHMNVKFELIESTVDEEGEVNKRTLREISFKVQETV